MEAGIKQKLKEEMEADPAVMAQLRKDVERDLQKKAEKPEETVVHWRVTEGLLGY